MIDNNYLSNFKWLIAISLNVTSKGSMAVLGNRYFRYLDLIITCCIYTCIQMSYKTMKCQIFMCILKIKINFRIKKSLCSEKGVSFERFHIIYL